MTSSILKYYVDQEGRVVATHSIDQDVPAEEYERPGVTISILTMPANARVGLEEVMTDRGRPDVVDVKVPADWETRFQLPVPRAVTRRQLKLAMEEEGLLSQVPGKIAAMSAAKKARTQVEWEDAEKFSRKNGSISDLLESLGLDEAGVDDLFRKAVRK